MWLNEWFWDETFWLPSGFKWEDLKSSPGIRRPSLTDYYIIPPLGILFVLFRVSFERFVAAPFCNRLGIKDVKGKLPESNAICEKVFKANNFPSSDRIEGLSKQLGWSLSRVRRWFRRKRNIGKPKLLKKATESCWRFLVYFLLVSLEWGILLQAEWFYDIDMWFAGFIHQQPVTEGMRWLHIFELAFYISLMVSQFVDVKRKDFWQMFIHHILTVFLVGFSYLIGIYRIGSVIMLVHDVSDIWLEAAKVANYAQMQRTCDGLFIIFAIVFYISRWIVFPFWVLHAALFVSYIHTGWYRSYYIFMGSLCVLQVLHIFWGFSIIRVIYQFAVVGKVEKDVRSEDEESTGDEKEPIKKKDK